MRYLKTFESFNINETMDMMTMPVDPIAGAADLYSDIYDEAKSYLKDKFNQFEDKLEQAIESALPKIDVKRAMESARKFFGKDPLSVTSEDIKLALEKTNENYDDADPYGEEGMETPLSQVKGGLVHKIGHILQMIFGINILSFGLFGTFIAWVTGVALINPAMSIVGAIVGYIVVHIIRKIAAIINPVY
jgi:hypothetical protein